MTLKRLGKVLSGLLLAYGTAIICAIAGFSARLLLDAVRPIAPYHCYNWDPQAGIMLVICSLVAPLVAPFTDGRARTLTIVAIGLVAFILATSAWSFTKITPCSPL